MVDVIAAFSDISVQITYKYISMSAMRLWLCLFGIFYADSTPLSFFRLKWTAVDIVAISLLMGK